MVLVATPDPSSSTGSTSELISFRELYYSLEHQESVTSLVTLRKHLKQAIPVFKSCGQDFPASLLSSKVKVNSDSVTLSNGKVIRFEHQHKALQKTISEMHGLGEAETALLLRIFLDSDDANLDHLTSAAEDYVSPLQQSTNVRRRKRPAERRVEAFSTQFFDTFTAFYFEERLYILRCISALIRISDDSFHELNELARDILDQFTDQAFALECLSKFQQLTQQDLSEEIREVPKYGIFWSRHSVREQLGLLEVVLLLYYSRLEVSAAIVQKIFVLIRDTDFGRAQASAGFLNDESSHLVDCVGSLLILLFVESLELEKCMEGLDLHSTSSPADCTNKQLIEAPEVVGEITDFLHNSASTDILRAPLLLSFALFLSRIDSALVEWSEARPTEAFPERLKSLQATLLKRGGVGVLWPDFVSASLSQPLNLFSTLESIITSPLFRRDSAVANIFYLSTSTSLALRAIFKGLVLSISQLIRPEYIQDYSGLISVWTSTFSSPNDNVGSMTTASDSTAAMCAQFWEIDSEYEERKAVLSMATRRFPVSFRPLLRLCRALSGESQIVGDNSMRAGTAVLGYLAQINTLAQVMPATSSFAIPYEPIETPSGVGLTYRATRNIPVFGKHLIIPAGTLGTMVSQVDQAPVVILWQLPEAGYSAWRLIRDVLANFVGLLDTSSVWKPVTRPIRDDSAVFQHQDDSIAHFSTMSPDETSDIEGSVVAGALQLFSAILSGGRHLSTALLTHLSGGDIAISDALQPTATSTKPNLIEIVVRILDQALNIPDKTSIVILSSLRLLNLLIPISSEAIWQAMRSSNILTGSSGMLPFSKQGIGLQRPSISLLSHEIDIGSFAGTSTLLELYQTLLIDLQKNQFSSSPEALQIKTEVIGRATHYVIHHIWTEYQNWKYITLNQQLEIGRKCTVFLDAICKDESLKRCIATKRLVDLVEDRFLSSSAAPAFTFAPLLRSLMDGQRMIITLQRAVRLVDVDTSRRHLLSSLGLILTMLRKSNQADFTFRTMGILESIIMKQEPTLSTGAARQDSVVKAVSNLILLNNEEAINIAAIKVMICLCRATSGLQASEAATLMGHLGSLNDVESFTNGLLSIVSESQHTYNLMVQTWNLLAAICETQPALATLLITGRHLSTNVEKQLAESQSEVISSARLIKSAIEIGKEVVLLSKEKIQSQSLGELAYLEGALKFLNVAWKHALEHREAFVSIRQDANFWSAIAQMSQMDAGPVPLLPPSSLEKIYIGESSEIQFQSTSSQQACLFALRRMCSARALELFLTDIKLAPIFSPRGKGQMSDRGIAYDRVMSIISKSEGLCAILEATFRFPCDALMQDDVVTRISQTFPEMPLDDFCVLPRIDDFDYTRPFGDSYVYDIDRLGQKLSGFAPTLEEELEGENMRQAALQQVIVLVAGLNLNWCMIDSQSAYLSAWTSLLTGFIGLLAEERVKDNQAFKAVQSSTMSAWIKCARITAEEDVESSITGGIHSLRSALLNALLKFSLGVSVTEKSNRQLQHDFGMPEEQIRDTLDQIEKIVAHSIFRVETAMRNRASFCRDVFEMVYLGVYKYRQVQDQQKSGISQQQRLGKAEMVRAMQLSAESLCLHTISCLRIAIDNAWAALSRRDDTYEEALIVAEEEIALLTSTLGMLLDPISAISIHIWAPKIQESSLLPAAIDLFSRSPMQYDVGVVNSSDEVFASGYTPAFSQPLLKFFFNLGNQQRTAELLVMSDIINGLCSNNFSALIDSSKGTIPPRLVNTSYLNPSHNCWMQMMQIVVALIVNLEGAVAERFIQTEVWSFFKVYEKKLMQILDDRILIGGATSMIGARRNGDLHHQELIRTNQVEETDLILRLYLYIIRARVNHGKIENAKLKKNGQDSTATLFHPYTKRISIQLQEFVHLLQHPRELTMLVGGMAEEEEKIKAMLITSSASVVNTMWEVSEGDLIMCSEPNDWDLGMALILPTISTSPSSASTTGTLLDLATYLVEQITRSRSSESEQGKLSLLLTILEQTAALCTTQLVLSAYSKPNPYSMTVRKDLETGLGRDVKQGLESARSAIQSVGQDSAFLSVIHNFHTKWLQGGD